MNIREAVPGDGPEIGDLLAQLGYPVEDEVLAGRLAQFGKSDGSAVFVYDMGGLAVGLIVLHLVPQLILGGDVVMISCLVVDEVFRDSGIGSELEGFAVAMGRRGKAVRIVLHCDAARTDAQRFYRRRGYSEMRKYLVKIL